MRIVTVFHPTRFCNLDCRYCWAPDKDDNLKLSLPILSEVLTQIYARSDLSNCDFLWLTGEPLVMGLDYFKSAVSLCKDLKPHHLSPEFIIQTNGTLINDAWAEFFAEHDFVVGVSIDGPKHIHDLQRVTKAGTGSFDATLRGINLLVKHGVKGSAICVISKATLNTSPDELFSFFYERKIAWSYLLEAKIGEHAASDRALDKSDLPKLQTFLGRLIELWGKHHGTYIRDFDQLSRRLFGAVGFQSNYNNLGCLDILNVTAEGDFYWGNPELLSATKGDLRHIRFNMSNADVWKCRESAEFKKVEREIHDGISKCQSQCPYFAGCQGGNPAHKYYQYGRFDITSHLTCELNDQIIPNLLINKLERELSELAA